MFMASSRVTLNKPYQAGENKTLVSHKKKYVGPMLAQLWACVCDVGPQLGQRRVDIVLLIYHDISMSVIVMG